MQDKNQPSQPDPRPVLPLGKSKQNRLFSGISYLAAVGFYVLTELLRWESTLAGVILLVLSLIAAFFFSRGLYLNLHYRQEPEDELVRENMQSAGYLTNSALIALFLLIAVCWSLFGKPITIETDGILFMCIGMAFVILRETLDTGFFLLIERTSANGGDADEEE